MQLFIDTTFYALPGNKLYADLWNIYWHELQKEYPGITIFFVAPFNIGSEVDTSSIEAGIVLPKPSAIKLMGNRTSAYHSVIKNAIDKHGGGYWITHIPAHITNEKLRQVFIATAIHSRSLNKDKAYAGKNISNALKQASLTITDSGVDKDFLKKLWSDKLAVIIPPVIEMEGDKGSETITSPANGKDYFAVACESPEDEQYVLSILKAFSIFKRWQQSGIQLIILTAQNDLSPGFHEKLRLYKYKQDVHIISRLYLKEYLELVSRAYAFMYIGNNGNNILPAAISAMQQKVPVITGNKQSVLKEYMQEAGFYANVDDVEDIAANMILLYKDERVCSDRVNKGTAIAEGFLFEKTIGELYETLKGI